MIFKMNEFKIGGKVTLSENEKYIIVDIVEYNRELYYFASTISKPVQSKIFKRIDENNKTYIEFIEDEKIIQEIVKIVINKL